MGSVTGRSGVGGLVGYNYAGIVNECYAKGMVMGLSYIGGLIGCNSAGTVNRSYWDTNTTGRTSSAGGTGKNTEEMTVPNTYDGWDFDLTWMLEGISYPLLQSFDIYTLAYSAGSHGVVSGCTNQTVNIGANGMPCKAVPDVGFHFNSWSDGVLSDTRTDCNVTNNLNVTAWFSVNVQ
jgi:hypothetical protein